MIVLSDNSVSYCHYDNKTTDDTFMSVETLRKGLLFAMKHNMSVNILYPNNSISESIENVINSFNSKKIKPFPCYDKADVIVANGIKEFEKSSLDFNGNTICRLSKKDILNNQDMLCECLNRVMRTNIVITDIDSFNDDDFQQYEIFLDLISQKVDIEKHRVNLISDRLEISEMNNCGAGDFTITLAPNGNFYVCPGFYYSDKEQNIGNVNSDLNIKNQHLYKIEYAPICSHCDAFHCKRCVWLNKKTTLEVNTPSHEQCVLAHLERNATRKWLMNHSDKQHKYKHTTINELSYLDPFEEYKKW